MIGSSRKRKNSDSETPTEIDISVYEVAEENIIDGKVPKTVHAKLQEEYGEWDKEESDKIHMIPMVFTDKGTKGDVSAQKAERAVFGALEKINAGKNVTDYFSTSSAMFGFVFHDRHYDGVQIDFVFVSIYGVMVVECKGVMQKKQANSKYRSAQKQMEKQLHIIEKVIGCLGLVTVVPIFKAVAFPNIKRRDIEVVNETHVLFKEDINDLKTWLRRKGFLSSKISFENYVKIASAFLEKYHINGTTNRFINGREFKKRAILDSHNNLENLEKLFLTKEQAGLVKVDLDHCNDLWVSGAAGTGKTLVLKHRAKSLTESYSDAEENVILVITFNLPINKDIKLWIQNYTKCQGKLVRVQTFSALLGHITRVLQGDQEQWKKVRDMEEDEKIHYILENKILTKYATSRYTHTPKYHHILVDEAQDLPGRWLELLDGIVRKTGQSHISIFEDPVQVVRRNAERPEIARFQMHSLKKVIRNTHNVFEAYEYSHESLREEAASMERSLSDKELSPPTIEHNVYGQTPEYITKGSGAQLKHELVATLERLQRQGVVFLDIAIITCGNEVQNVTDHLETAGIRCENAEKAVELKYSNKRRKSDIPVIVDSYQRFKGLESKVLIYFIPPSWKPHDVDIYVGFSRSFCHLIVIGTQKTIDNIKERQEDAMRKNA